MAFVALDANRAIPADPDQLGKTARIVGVALVHPNGQHRMRVAGVNADDRQADTLEFVPQPTRHRARFEANQLRYRRSLGDHPRKCARIRRDLALEQNFPVLVEDTYRRLFLRHVQSDILLHGCSPAGCLDEAETIGPRVPRRAATRDYATYIQGEFIRY